MSLKVESESEIDLPDNSLDNSADSEYLGMVDEGSFGSAEERSLLVTRPYLEATEEESTGTYSFKDLSGSVTYKIVHMAGEEPSHTNHSPVHPISGTEFYIIGETEQFNTAPLPKKILPKESLEVKAVTAKKRDDKRRATHNEVERRRRDKINSWITKLAALVPNSGLPDTASKGGILAKACDYITELTNKQKRLEKLELENEKLVLEILRLNEELSDVRKENTSMRSQLADNCIVLNQRPKGQKS